VTARPDGFYTEWTVFCGELLGDAMKDNDDEEWLAAVLLAAGPLLGNRGFGRFAKTWMGPLAATGLGAVLSLALTGPALASVMLARQLKKKAPSGAAAGLEKRLASARREFEELRQDREDGHLDDASHRVIVDHLYGRLARSPELKGRQGSAT